jgi:transposase
MIEDVDRRVKAMMQRLPSKVAEEKKPPKEKNPRKTPCRNEPPQLPDDLYRTFGVDLTQVPGINTLTAQMLLTEVGPDLSRFPTAAAFCSGCDSVQIRRLAAAKSIRHEQDQPRNAPLFSPSEWALRDCTTVRLLAWTNFYRALL